MEDPTGSRDVVDELADMRRRIERLESGWQQIPFSIPMIEVVTLDTTFTNTGLEVKYVGSCIITAQYLHYLFIVDDSSYTGGGDIQLTISVLSTVGNFTTPQLTTQDIDGVFYQGAIDLFELAGNEIRGTEAIIQLNAGVSVAGGSVAMSVPGSFTLRGNPVARYDQIYFPIG